MANTAFLLAHVHELTPDQEDIKIIGIYSSEALARAAEARAKLLPGFKRVPEGFQISAYTMDEDNWREGFVTMHLRPPKKTGRRAKQARSKAKSVKKAKVQKRKRS